MDGSGIEGRNNFYLWTSFLLVADQRSLSVYVTQRSNSSYIHALHPLYLAFLFFKWEGLSSPSKISWNRSITKYIFLAFKIR